MAWWNRVRSLTLEDALGAAARGALHPRQALARSRGKATGPPPVQGFFANLSRERGVEHDHDYSEFAKSYGSSHPYVFACVDLRASSLAALPLRLWQRTGDEPREITRGPLVDLLQSVNPDTTWRDLAYSTSVDYDLNGNAYWWLNPGAGGGFPAVELWRLRPDRVRIRQNSSGQVDAYLYGSAEKPTVYPPEQVVHFRFPHPFNDVYGLARMLSAALTADTAKRAAENDLDDLKRGMVADAFVKLPGAFDDTEVKAFMERLERRFNTGKHGVYPVTPETEIVQLQTQRRDMEFAQMRQYNREEICSVFGVPGPLVGDLTRSTYANMEQAEQQFWGTTMSAHAAALAGTLTEKLLSKFGSDLYCEFDFSGVEALQEDTLAERQQDLAEVQAGAKTINEFRAKWEPDAPAVPWGDTAYLPLNLLPVGMLGGDLAPPTEPPPGKGVRLLDVKQAPPQLGDGEGKPHPFLAPE